MRRHRRFGRLAGAVLPALLAAGAATGAETVAECDWRGRADNIPEPWSETSRTFAEGAIRIALSDPGEPACCSASLIVLVPDPVAGRACFLVRDDPVGWHGVDIAGVTARYDPARGLHLSVPVAYPHPLGGPDPERAREIGLWVNQAAGTVSLD